MADNATRRFNLNSWAINLGVTLVVLISMFAICQGSNVNASDNTNNSQPNTAVAQNSASTNSATTPANTPANTSGNSTSSDQINQPNQTTQPSTNQNFIPTTPRRTTPDPIEQNSLNPDFRPNNNESQLPSSNGTFQSAPNPQSPPNPQFNQGTVPDQTEQMRDTQRQLNTDPFEQETRQTQREQREQIDPETPIFQRDENGLLIDDSRQVEDDGYIHPPLPQNIFFDESWPYDVLTYSQFLQLDYIDAFGDAAPSYPYVSDGIRYLANALFALSEQHDATPNSRNQHLDDLNALADQLQNESTDFDASKITSNAFVQITNWMQEISDSSFPFSRGTDEIEDVESSARKIETNRDLQDQQYEVRRFFSLAEIAIHALVE